MSESKQFDQLRKMLEIKGIGNQFNKLDYQLSLKDENYIHSLMRELGKGLTEPGAYETAWVARIPSLDYPNKPAFPKSLIWLRKHQLSDGSWGTKQPYYAHGNTLSTLAAVIALKHWDLEQDQNRIKDGIKALSKLLEDLETEKFESIGFEMLFPSLINSAEKYGLKINYAKIHLYRERMERKVELIQQFKKKHGILKEHAWWYSLEHLAGSERSEEIFQNLDKLIEKQLIIGASPAASAFALMHARLNMNKDIPRAFEGLNELYLYNDGGIPGGANPIDGFELSFSLGFFSMANIPLSKQVFGNGIKKLNKMWIESKGLISSSKYLPPDPDVTAITIYVLTSANILSGVESLDTLVKFFNGSYMRTYDDELNPSVSANIHSVLALKHYKNITKIKEIIDKIINWLNKQISDENFLLEDKWHISPYYAISRAVFAMEGIDDSFASKCVNQLKQYQRIDGGWGIGSYSTLEETSYACLAMCHWVRSKNREDNKKILKILLKSRNFINKFDGKKATDELWIGKSLYCPTLVVESLVFAARYALKNILISK